MEAFRFKLVLIGPASVGKTSLLHRFVNNKFSHNYNLTIGVDFLAKDVEINEDLRAKLTIWDIGGQKRFEFMRRNFYDGSNGALLIFDLTRETTFTEMKRWLEEFRKFAGSDIPFILIGNKIDLVEETGRVIQIEEVDEFTKKNNCIYIETSAKTGQHVEDAFIRLAQIMANLK